LIIGGSKIDREELEVINPYDNSVVGRVPIATKEEIDKAVESAKEGFKENKALSPRERYEFLIEASEILSKRKEEFSKSLVTEVGKTIREARLEVERAIENLIFAAEESKRVEGSQISFDSSKFGRGKVGFYARVPIGIILAISPFNFPLNLSLHKVAPALASGNSFILKPSSYTPLTPEMMCEALLEAGAPEKSVNLLTGPGGKVGEELVKHPEIRMVTFTGSKEVGERISSLAGFKKITLELGSNSSLIIDENSKYMEKIERIVSGSFSLAGQVCISVQRIFVHEKEYKDFLDALVQETEKLKVGNPMDEKTDIGPLIDEKSAIRVENWIEEAIEMGANLETGGERRGNLMTPTILTDVSRESNLFRKEAFGPVVIVNKFSKFSEAIEMSNDSEYGLQAGVFTEDLRKAFEAFEKLEVGGVVINDVPTFRVDHMPYGGTKGSGIGREGPRYAIEEMTELKLLCIDLGQSS